MKYSNSTVIRCLSGEGRGALLKRRNFFSRILLGAKIIIKIFYMLAAKPERIDAKDLIYSCGVNQDRFLKSLDLSCYGLNDESVVIKQPRKFFKRENENYISMKFRYAIVLVFFCILYIFTGNNRYLAAFFLGYYRSVSDFLNSFVSNVDRFICFNDQPFESASIVLWFRENNKKTVVLQHGVILSYDYYFPTNSNEFWAWGRNGHDCFKTKVKYGTYVVKGRCLKEKYHIPSSFVLPDRKNIKAAICPSFIPSEILGLIRLIRDLGCEMNCFYLKLHPSTKFKFFYRIVAFLYGLGWINYKAPILSVADNFDILVTKNSSAAVDFLLLGKPVFGIDTSEAHREIFKNSLLSIRDMKLFLEGKEIKNLNMYNKNRTLFIKDLV